MHQHEVADARIGMQAQRRYLVREPGQPARVVPPRVLDVRRIAEGRHAGGIDFGQWRSADPAVYGPAFQTQIRQRFANQTNGELRASLEANGFACEDERRLDCRIEIMERQCAFDWYVVLERGSREPVAGFEQIESGHDHAE